MADDLFNYRLQEAEAAIKAQKEEIEALEGDMTTLRTEIAKRDRQNLIWGISVLGGLVTTLAGILWQYRGVIFRGGQ